MKNQGRTNERTDEESRKNLDRTERGEKEKRERNERGETSKRELRKIRHYRGGLRETDREARENQEKPREKRKDQKWERIEKQRLKKGIRYNTSHLWRILLSNHLGIWSLVFNISFGSQVKKKKKKERGVDTYGNPGFENISKCSVFSILQNLSYT